jgi:hypothetical protein
MAQQPPAIHFEDIPLARLLPFCQAEDGKKMLMAHGRARPLCCGRKGVQDCVL